MDFLGALGRDCTAESDPAPRPLPPARPAASVPVAPPASADQIRRRFENQRRELAPRGGRSSSPREPLRAVPVARSGAEAVAHPERSPRRRSSAARDDKRESRRDDRHGVARSPRRAASRSRSRDRRSHRHRSPAHRSSRQRSPARQTSGHGPPAPRSPPPAKRQRLCSPRRGDRSSGRQRQQGPSRPQSPVRSNASGRARRGRRGGYGLGGNARPAPSAVERRLLDRLDDVEKELRRSRAGSASPSAPRAVPVVPLSALLPHNPFGSPARSERPLPAGMGFVGAGGGPPWAQFAPPCPLPAPRDLALSSHRARTSAFPPPMKKVTMATLARLWSLAASLQGLERILQESYDSMPVSPPSRFSQKPRADCHAAASALFALVTPLQVEPSPGATSASQLADSALALRTLVAGPGTPVDVVVDVCGSYFKNPCYVGTCINDLKGSYSCICPSSHIERATNYGFPTCEPGDASTI
ncbi:unnamed protein product [Closterium sp. Naga37s-1]|nr:unnamed protein product [Closterium sp. Naga37s-1]